MKLVIEISDRAYEAVKKNGLRDVWGIEEAICNGTPLPKGHGALKDEKDLLTKVELNYLNSTKPIYVESVKDMIRTTVSVIKADREGAEECR